MYININALVTLFYLIIIEGIRQSFETNNSTRSSILTPQNIRTHAVLIPKTNSLFYCLKCQVNTSRIAFRSIVFFRWILFSVNLALNSEWAPIFSPFGVLQFTLWGSFQISVHILRLSQLLIGTTGLVNTACQPSMSKVLK